MDKFRFHSVKQGSTLGQLAPKFSDLHASKKIGCIHDPSGRNVKLWWREETSYRLVYNPQWGI